MMSEADLFSRAFPVLEQMLTVTVVETRTRGKSYARVLGPARMAVHEIIGRLSMSRDDEACFSRDIILGDIGEIAVGLRSQLTAVGTRRLCLFVKKHGGVNWHVTNVCRGRRMYHVSEVDSWAAYDGMRIDPIGSLRETELGCLEESETA